MKKKYEVYELGSEVYCISHHHKDGKPTSYIAIFNAIVKTVYIYIDKNTGNHVVSYWLSTPDGNDWGDSVPADQVSNKIDVLVEKMKLIWSTNSNSHD